MTPDAASANTAVDAEVVRRMAALGGLHLSPEQAAAHVPALHELLVVDVAIAALELETLPAVGHPWGAWSHDAGTRG